MGCDITCTKCSTCECDSQLVSVAIAGAFVSDEELGAADPPKSVCPNEDISSLNRGDCNENA